MTTTLDPVRRRRPEPYTARAELLGYRLAARPGAWSRKGVHIGQKRLAVELACDVRTVRRATRALADAGRLVEIPHKRVQQPDGTWLSTGFKGYRLVAWAKQRMVKDAVRLLNERAEQVRRAHQDGLPRSHRPDTTVRSSPSGSGAGDSRPPAPPGTGPPAPRPDHRNPWTAAVLAVRDRVNRPELSQPADTVRPQTEES